MGSVNLNKPRKERDIERYLYDRIRRMGGLCLKWESQHKAGLPDRLVFISGRFFMIELKQDKGRLSEGQIKLHKEFKEQGFNVIVLYGIREVKEFVDNLESTLIHEQEMEQCSPLF